MPFEQYTREQMPTLASGVVIFGADRDDVLLVHQAYGRHLWTTPGGMLEPDEAPAEAAIRECIEGLGCEVRLDRLVGVYYVRRPIRRQGLASCSKALGDVGPSLADSELDDIGWFPVANLPSSLSPGLDIVIADARGGATGLFKVIDDAS